MVCGIVCGLGFGAKLTNAVWIPAALALAIAYRGWRQTARDALRFLPALAVAAVLAHPLLLRGPSQLLQAIAQAHEYDRWSAYLYLGRWASGPPWHFPLAVLLAKTSWPALLWCGGAVGWGLAASARERRMAPWFSVVLVVGGLDLFFVLKPFQNAHYYLPAFAALMVAGAVGTDRLLLSTHRIGRALAVGIVWLSLLVQAALNAVLAPDFAQAGRQYGPAFQGEMWGPAVNHCQGGPLAVAELNELQRRHPYPQAFVLGHCRAILEADQIWGPVRAVMPIEELPAAPPPRPYWLLVHRVYDFYSYRSAVRWNAKMAEKRQRLQGCALASRDPDAPYQIYACMVQ